MALFEIRQRLALVISIVVLGIGTTVSSARQDITQKEGTQGIKATDITVLAAPEGVPLNMPSDVAVGPDGKVYVLDGVNNRVVVYDVQGKFTFQFGGGGSGLGQLSFPLGIATAPDGKVFIADSGNHRFQIFEPDGRPQKAVSLPSEQLKVPPDPTDVAVDPNRNKLYIADNDNHHVLVYNLAEGCFESVWGSPGQDQRQFRFPFLMDVSPQGYLLVVEPINTRVQVLNPDGKFVNFIGGWGIKPGQLFRPKGVVIYKDKVYVTDSYLGIINIFNIRAGFLGVLTDAVGAPIKFTTPTGIASDSKRKRLYVVELKANQVRRLDLE